MDMAYFVRERTKIIRLFYEEGRVPFERLKQSIEDGSPPWEPPRFSWHLVISSSCHCTDARRLDAQQFRAVECAAGQVSTGGV
jgi:hypothetical protein